MKIIAKKIIYEFVDTIKHIEDILCEDVKKNIVLEKLNEYKNYIEIEIKKIT